MFNPRDALTCEVNHLWRIRGCGIDGEILAGVPIENGTWPCVQIEQG